MVSAHPEIPGLVDWRPLARGGFSTVWQARQEHLDRLVAIKVDHRTLNEDKERRRFLREAGAAGRLSGHEGIVTVHDAGILDDGRPYLVMDLCTGGSLTQWLKPEGRRSQQRIRDVGVRIAAALAAAHAEGVLHRDVKPANILIDRYDNAGLADFGLAAIPEPGVDLSVTLEGMTPAYAPKEVFYLKPPTEYGDVYSLAATLYALLDGKPPRWPDRGTPSLPELLELQRRPIDRLSDVDRDFMELLLRAMDDDPERRLTAAQFRDELAALTFRSPESAGAGSAEAGTAGAGIAGVGSAGAEPPTPAGRVPDADPPDPSVAPAARPLEGASGRRSRRPLAAALLLAGLIVALLIANMFRGAAPSAVSGVDPKPVATDTAAATTGPASTPTATRTTPTATTSSTAGTATSPAPSGPASKTASPLPAGFADCSQRLDGQSYCLTEPECWTDLLGYADLLTQGTMQDCDKSHLYQTYAAGVLKKPVRRQSALEARPEVQALCTRPRLNQVLVKRSPRKDWQIAKLGPQVVLDDDFFRCLFSTGGFRTGALALKTH